MVAVIIALIVGVFTGAGIVWMTVRAQGAQTVPGILQAQGEIKAQLEATVVQVERIAAVFANAAQRGRAGEFVLENLLEETGMAQHRDFDVQVGVADAARPDVVLKLAGRGRLIIDAKFPLDDFARVVSATTEEDRRKHLAAHAKAMASHIAALAQRDYPSKVPGAINFTVCFIPAEDLLAAAYEQSPTLFYDAIRNRVLPATPATLMALLWGVAYGWQQDARFQQAQQIGEEAAKLHKRLGPMVDHLQKLGRSLNGAIKNYDDLVGSLEARVLPQARKFEDLGILPHGSHLSETQSIGKQVRPVSIGLYPLASDIREVGALEHGSDSAAT